jgi:NTE family protein
MGRLRRCVTILVALLLTLASAGGASVGAERVALVFGGGAARGAAHIGVIEVLTEAGVPIDMIVATSMGAIVGGLYASGFEVAQLSEIVTAIDPSGAVTLQLPPRGGLLDSAPLEIILDALLEGRTFADTRIPFQAIVVDLETGEPQAAPGTSISRGLRASAALPVLMNPVEIDGRYFVDGGLKEIVPASFARDLGATYVIAVYISREAPFDPGNVQANLSRIVADILARYAHASLENADVIIDPGLQTESYMDFWSAERYIAAGRDAAREQLPTILDDLARRGVALVPPGDPNAGHPINEGWRERFEVARRLVALRERPLALGVDLAVGGGGGLAPERTGEFGPVGSRFRFGVDLRHGPLGAASVGASYARSLDGLHGAVQLRASYAPVYGLETFTVHDIDLAGGWSGRAGVRASLSARLTVEAALRLPGPVLEAAGGYHAPHVWLDATVAHAWDGWSRTSLHARTALGLRDPAWDAYTLRLRAYGALASSGTPPHEALVIGPHLVRGTRSADRPSYALLVGSVEVDARLSPPTAVANVALIAPHLRVFVEGAWHDHGPLVALGGGLALDGSLFGFVPIHLDLEVAYGLTTRSVGVSFRRAVSYPEPWRFEHLGP